MIKEGRDRHKKESNEKKRLKKEVGKPAAEQKEIPSSPTLSLGGPEKAKWHQFSPQRFSIPTELQWKVPHVRYAGEKCSAQTATAIWNPGGKRDAS